MKPDDVARKYAARRVGLTVRMLDADEDVPDPMVLIEGKPEALLLLAELLEAVAQDPVADGFGMSPRSAGKGHFSSKSTLGIYVHRLPRQQRPPAPRSPSRSGRRRKAK